MYLELADNGTYQPFGGPDPARDAMGNYLPSYLRDDYQLAAENEAMLLAQDPKALDYQLAQENTDNAYLFIPNLDLPGGGTYVREDLFDDLDDEEWLKFMNQIEPYQPDMGLFGIGKRAQQRRTDRIKMRLDAKQSRVATRAESGKPGVLESLTSIGKSAAAAFGGAGAVPPEGEFVNGEAPPPPAKKDNTGKILMGVGAVLVLGTVVAIAAKKKDRG